MDTAKEKIEKIIKPENKTLTIRLYDDPSDERCRYSNRHNVGPINLRIRPENYREVTHRRQWLTQIHLTKHQIKRILKHYCGRADCLCGSYPRQLDGDKYMTWQFNGYWLTYTYNSED